MKSLKEYNFFLRAIILTIIISIVQLILLFLLTDIEITTQIFLWIILSYFLATFTLFSIDKIILIFITEDSVLFKISNIEIEYRYVRLVILFTIETTLWGIIEAYLSPGIKITTSGIILNIWSKFLVGVILTAIEYHNSKQKKEKSKSSSRQQIT